MCVYAWRLPPSHSFFGWMNNCNGSRDMNAETVQQVLTGGVSVAVAVAVLRTQMAFHAKELERLDKMIQACFRRIDELRDRK